LQAGNVALEKWKEKKTGFEAGARLKRSVKGIKRACGAGNHQSMGPVRLGEHEVGPSGSEWFSRRSGVVERGKSPNAELGPAGVQNKT